MNRVSVVIVTALLLASCTSESPEPTPPVAMNPTVNSSPNQIPAHEVYVQLYPRDGYLHVKEYNLGSVLPADSIPSQIARLKAKISALELSESEYIFEVFDAKEESLFMDRGFVTGEYHLKTDERNLNRLIADSFAKVLRRPVTLTINDSGITIEFNNVGLRVADNNSTGVYANSDNTRTRMTFRNGQRMYESVFTFDRSDNVVSLAESFGDNVHAEKEPSS